MHMESSIEWLLSWVKELIRCKTFKWERMVMVLVSAHFISLKKFDFLIIIRPSSFYFYCFSYIYSAYSCKYMFYLLAKGCTLHGTST